MNIKDTCISDLIVAGRLRVDANVGLVFAPLSNTPEKPVGATTKKGYLRLCANVEGKQHHFMVHRIVWVSIFGAVPDGFEIDHRNGNKTDNRIVNLEAVPGRENMRRAREMGRFAHCGDANRNATRDNKGRASYAASARRPPGGCWTGWSTTSFRREVKP